MRKHRLGTVVSMAALAVGVVACNNDKLTSINTDPNNPTDAPAGSLFTRATEVAVSRWYGAGAANSRGAEFVIQHMTEDQYSDEDRYVRIDPATTSGTFSTPYQSELKDLQVVITKGQAASAPGIWGPAQVLQSWEFSELTNAFGDVPYSQALKGDSGVLTPAYDPQKSIYTDLFSKLQSTATALNGDNTGVTLGSNDPIYKGNEKEWAKFANSLHLRLALQIVNIDKATASQQIQAALAAPGGVFTSNADNAKLAWPGDGVFDNPIGDFFQSRDDNRMSATLMNLMIGLNDPRIPIFAQPATATLSACQGNSRCNQGGSSVNVQTITINGQQYYGEPNGLATNAATTWSNASRIGVQWYPGATAYGTFGTSAGLSFPSYIMTYAEVLFIQAEAAERSLGGLTPGQAAGFYNAGITASMNQWGVTDAGAIAAYLAQPGVAYQGGTAGLVQIAQQEYIALFMQGPEAWSLWRRTCVPSTVQAGPSANQKQVPRRFRYAPTEYSINPTSINAAKANMGGDTFNTKVWWDVPTAAPTYVAGSCGGV